MIDFYDWDEGDYPADREQDEQFDIDLDGSDEMDRLYDLEESMSVVQNDQWPAPPATYLPEYAFVDAWYPGRRFQVVETVGDDELLFTEAECEFVAAMRGCEAMIYFRMPDGRRECESWANIRPLTEKEKEGGLSLPDELRRDYWLNVESCRFIRRCVFGTESLYPSMEEVLPVIEIGHYVSDRIRFTVIVLEKGERRRYDNTDLEPVVFSS